jgi:2-desacetyl-2-hydroxyethyl bacteriochlorophyllide A dehydrogenase
MRSVVFTDRGVAAVKGTAGPDGALMLRGQERLVEPLAEPHEAEPGQLLCRAVFTGVTNGTERNMLLGGNYSPKTWPIPLVGYQNVGRVLAVGADVEGFAVGDLVYSGITGHVECYAIPATAESLTIKLPDKVEPQHAALFGVASVAMHDVRRAAVKLGENVLVVGAGLIGQFTAQAARLAGAIVTVCDLDQDRLELAGELGAHATVALTTEAESWEAVRERGPFDVVFEDSGAPVLDRIIGETFGEGILRPPAPGGARSRLALIAGRERVEYSFNAAQGHEITLMHASHFDGSDLEQVCRFTAEGGLRIGPLIKDVLKLAEAPSLYRRLVDEPDTLLGSVFDWQ